MEKAIQIQSGGLPAGLDPHDPVATRAWVVDGAEQEVALRGRLTPAMRVLLPDRQLLVQTPFLAGEEQASVAVFHRLLRTEGAIRGYREGEITADGQRKATVLEHDAAGNAWACWRSVATHDGAVGVFLGDAWTEIDDREPALHAWLDAGGRSAEMGPDRVRDTPPPPFEVRMAAVTLDVDVPTDAEAVAEYAGSLLDSEISTKGLDSTVVLVFRGRAFERWELRGTPSGTVDDALRAIALSSDAQAIALVTGIVGEFYGATRRAVAIVAETTGRRFERALPLTFDPAGGAFPLPPVGRWHDALTPESRWIGTAPTHPIRITRP